MKILIVDDTTFMRTTIRRLLEQQNMMDNYEAVDGLEALTKYKIIRPDVVIMDISMPVMDGIEAVKLIKAFDPGANIIICSLQGQKANVMEAIRAGAKSFLVKPVKQEKLLAEISKLRNNGTKASEEEEKEVARKLDELKDLSDSDEDLRNSEDFLLGVESGYLEARREIATNMVRIGISMDQIMKCVELSEEEIEDIKIEYRLL